MAQDTFAQLLGTMRDLFHFGGPKRALIAGRTGDTLNQILETRDENDSAFAIHRGADPVGPNDFTTKQYVDAVAAPNAVKSIRMNIGTAAAYSSTESIPANAVIMRASVKVVTPYDNSADITVGSTLVPAAYMASGDSDLSQPADTFYIVDQDTLQTLASTVEVAVSNTPTAGTATVTVYYSTPAA